MVGEGTLKDCEPGPSGLQEFDTNDEIPDQLPMISQWLEEESITDDYHHTVAGGHEYIEGQFMEKVDDMPNKGILYKLMPKKTFFYK